MDLSLESDLSLQQEKEALKLQEELLELDKKNLEYQYKLGQLADADFLSQYAALLEEKQGLKEQRELLDAQLKLYNELLGTRSAGAERPAGPLNEREYAKATRRRILRRVVLYGKGTLWPLSVIERTCSGWMGASNSHITQPVRWLHTSS